MDRRIIYPGAIPQETDLLGADKWALEGLADLAGVVLGTSAPAVNGLAVGPNSPLGLSVVVQPGSIYAPLQLDATAYSTMGTDTHVVMQQGLLRDALVLAITPPPTVGQSRVYLVQAACQVVDTDSDVLPYYNAADPTVALTGPGNSGTPQNTRRAVNAVINLKAGTPATTGTQVTPSVDAGFVALAAVVVANGATTITSANIVATLGLRRASTPLPDVSSFLGVQVFTFGATYIPTPGMKTCIIECQGGGGAGGGAAGAVSTNVSLGAPGASGSYAKGRFTAADIGASKTVTVGGGGGVVSGGTGASGGTSSVGGLISAPGGPGGGTLPNQAPPTLNGNGTFASPPSGGNIVAIQGAGQVTSIAVSNAIVAAAAGGASVFGPGGYGIGINAPGAAAPNPGAGGSGSAVNGAGGSIPGGAGFRGVVIIWEYS